SQGPLFSFALPDNQTRRFAKLRTPSFDTPVIATAGNAQVHILESANGSLRADDVSSVAAEDIRDPADTLAVCSPGPQFIVPDSNVQGFAGQWNQSVIVYDVDGTRLGSVADDFENPWLLAEGDFVGGAERELAIAERRLEGASPQTNNPGRLRFFRRA